MIYIFKAEQVNILLCLENSREKHQDNMKEGRQEIAKVIIK